jgi:hypothetical protein
MPTTYAALFKASLGLSSAVRSTAVSLAATVLPTTANNRMYRCTTAGTTGSGEPTWPTAAGGTVTDGTAVWTEMTPDFQTQTNLTEAAYTSYARVALGTSGSSLFGAASNGSSGNASTQTNTSAVGFPANTGSTEVLGMWGIFDASTSGNLLEFGGITEPKSYASGDTPSISVSAFTTTNV